MGKRKARVRSLKIRRSSKSGVHGTLSFEGELLPLYTLKDRVGGGLHPLPLYQLLNVIQNGDRTWKCCAAFGDPLQVVVPYGQPADNKYPYHCQGPNCFFALDAHGGEL